MRLFMVAVASSALQVGCGNPSIESNEVIQLTSCDPLTDSLCRPIADGHSLVTVGACTAASGSRVSPLNVTVQLSGSAWANPPDPTNVRTFAASLVKDTCTHPVFIADTSPGPVRIDAELLGFHATTFVTLGPASLVALTIVPTPAVLTARQVNTISVASNVRGANGGDPSRGTRIAYSITQVVPSTAVAYVIPSDTDLQSTTPVQLHTDSTVTSVTIAAMATPPTVPGTGAATGVSGTLTLRALQ